MPRLLHNAGRVAAALLVSACDAELSGFDRVNVSVDMVATETATSTLASSRGGDSGDDGGAEVEAGEDGAANGGNDAAATGGDAGADAGMESGGSDEPASDDGAEAGAGDDSTTGSTPDETSGSATDSGTDSASGTSTSDGATPIVSAGADLAANASFSRLASVTGDSATTVEWTMVSGPGSVSFGTPHAAATTISATGDGVYVIRVTAEATGGLQASDDFTLTWDTTGPTNAAWGLTIGKSAGGAHAGVLNENDDLEVFLEWAAATDAVGVRDYTLTYYTDANCGGSGGVATSVTGLSSRSQALTLANGAVRSFTVRAYDDFGQVSAESACSASITVDTSDPVDITDLQAATGSDVATVLVSVDFDTTAGVIADYDTVRIVRGASGGAAASCASSTVVQTYTTGQFVDGSFTDFTNGAGANFEYRACVYDAAGNVVSGQFASAVSKNHILFVGLPGGVSVGGDFALAPPGSLGVARGDAVCQAEAAASADPRVTSETASHWRAILSDATTDAKWRTVILGTVRNPLLDETYATGRSTFWNGALSAADAPDDDAFGGETFASVWTGSSAAGLRTGLHCSNWTDGASGATGSIGNPSVATADWIGTGTTLACNDAFGAGVYCINQPAAPQALAVTSGITTAASVTLSIDVPDDSASLRRFDRITIRRLAGGAFPDGNCEGGGDTVVPSGFGSGFPGFPVVATAQSIVDSSAIAGSTTYRYRVCGYDVHGNLLSSTTATATTP